MENLFGRFQALWRKQQATQSDLSDPFVVLDEDRRKLYTVLSIGAASAKAAIVEVKEDQAFVLGVGRHTLSSTHMSDGIVTDIAGVIASSNQALLQAENAAGGIIAPSAIINITGELVKGSAVTVTRQRQRPSTPITPEELKGLISSAHWKLLKSARERIATETGHQNIEVRLMNASVTSTYIDGRSVINPIGFRGSQFGVTLFCAFAPWIQLGALETVAQGLDLTLITIVAEPYALARCLSSNASTDNGAVFIHVSGHTTEIALVRQGGIEDTRMFALGDKTFIRRIATNKGITIKDAMQIKACYSSGDIDASLRDEVQNILVPECQTWMDSTELLFEELAKDKPLPPAVYLLGEGADLPDLFQHLERFPWTERLPFTRSPIVRVISPAMISRVVDTNAFLRKDDVVLMALAYSLMELQGSDDPVEAVLAQAIDERQGIKAASSLSGDPSVEKLNNNEGEEIQGRPPQPRQNTQSSPMNEPAYQPHLIRRPEPKRYEPRKARTELPGPRSIPSYNPESFNETNKRVLDMNGPVPLRRSLRIFLCHSSDDKVAVRKLYQQLRADGFNPWLDEQKLLPGQEWQIEIPKAVRNSHVVIVCLSRKSIQKTGYVQKEIKYALDVADEQPEGTLFMIPLKLEECNVPERLSRWQWVNSFDANGYKRLVFALRKRAKDI